MAFTELVLLGKLMLIQPEGRLLPGKNIAIGASHVVLLFFSFSLSLWNICCSDSRFPQR